MATESQQPIAVRRANTAKNRATDAGAAGGKYNVEQLTFPSDLFSAGPAKYNNSWMMININMIQQSKYAASTATANLSDAERAADNRRSGEADARGNSQAGAIGNAALSGGVVAGASALSKVNMSNVMSKQGPARKQAIMKEAVGVFGKAAGAAAATGAAVGAVVLTAGTATRETKRIAAAIQLPMPNQLTTAYNMKWGDDSTAMFDAMMRGLSNLAPGSVGDAASAAVLGTGKLVNAQGLSAATGLAYNPKKEMYFESVGFRAFTLNYDLYPKTPQEADIIRNIVFMLKFHMHPEYKTEGRYTFVYPSEFDITFYHRGRENEWINKVATCVLTDLQVNYTPDGLWAAHSEGEPNKIQLSMSFRELTVLTKELIDEGF